MAKKTNDLIKEHYELEKKLAAKLRNATKKERKKLYTQLYNELYEKLPNHPRWMVKNDPKETKRELNKQMAVLRPYLKKGINFLEVGPGDCKVALEVSKTARMVYAVDVSDEVTKNRKWPKNFKFILSDGSSIPVEENSIDLVFSYQLMEHLHPDDAFDQIKSIFKALKPGGKYICVTPNRLNGPHDISRNFDKTPTGFHLKEYTNKELMSLFKKAGFKKFDVMVAAKGIVFFKKFPVWIIKTVESVLEFLPYSIRNHLANFYPTALLIGVKIVAKK